MPQPTLSSSTNEHYLTPTSLCLSLNLWAGDIWVKLSMLPLHEVVGYREVKEIFYPSDFPSPNWIFPSLLEIRSGWEWGGWVRYLVFSLSQEWNIFLFSLKYFIFDKTHQIYLCQGFLPRGLV